jgi:uncharacterized protein with FMN-binding domain
MTTAASGLVAVLDQPSSGSARDVGGDTAVVVSETAGTSAPLQPPVVSSTIPAVVDPAVVEQPTASAVPTTVATSVAAATTTTAVAASGVCAGQTIDGSTVDTRWGPVQVEATVSATGEICDVDAIQSPNDHRRSVQINQNALPILHTQVMQAQSTDINGVSGATVTTRGYVSSLQSILDSVGG